MFLVLNSNLKQVFFKHVGKTAITFYNNFNIITLMSVNNRQPSNQLVN